MLCAPVGTSHGSHGWWEPETLRVLPEQAALARRAEEGPGMPALCLGTWGFGPIPCDFESCHPPARHHPFHSLSQPLLHILYNICHTTRTRTRTCACTFQSSRISAKWGENQSWTSNVSGPVGKQSVIFQSPERGHGGPFVGRRGVRRSRKGYLAPALSKDPQGPLEGWEEYPQLDWRPPPAQGFSGWRRL